MNAALHHGLAAAAPDGIVLGQSPGTCGCDAQFHRPVMFEALTGPGMIHGCMKCGRATYAELRGDDGRYTGEPASVYVQLAVADEPMKWLAAWPRVIIRRQPSLWFIHQAWARYDTLYLPAGLRCRTPESLAEEEARQSALQSRLSARARLLKAGIPHGAPPASLPPVFAPFSAAWHDLQLSTASDLQGLIDRTRAGSLLAAEVLMQHEEVNAVVERLLREGDLFAVLLLLRAGKPQVPHLEEALLERLKTVPMNPHPSLPDRIERWASVELALLIIAEQHLASPAMMETLRAFMRKVARHDAALVNCLRIVLRELASPSLS